MTLSIWWFIGLSQLTLLALGGCIWLFLLNKVSKENHSQLKESIKQIIKDYQVLADHIDIKDDPLAEVAPETNSNPEHLRVYQRVTELHNHALATMSDWSQTDEIDIAEISQDPDKLQGCLEHYFIHIATTKTDNDAMKTWTEFCAKLCLFSQDVQATCDSQRKILDSITSDWYQTKPRMRDAFDLLVRTGQQTDKSNEIHEATNEIYNDFVNILNLIPEISEENEDAFLKMESSTQSALPADETTEELNDDDEIFHVAPSESARNTESDMTESDISDLLNEMDESMEEANQLAQEELEVSDDSICELETIQGDNEEDHLAPPAAIADFDEDSTTLIAKSRKGPQEEDFPADMFDDLLSTVDDALEHQEELLEPKHGSQENAENQ